MDKIVELLSRRIVDWLCVNNRIESDKEELYKYSALISIQSAINILATLFLGFIFNAFFENICFFIVFKILRKYSGGLHSSRFSTCFILSILTNTLVLIAIKLLMIYPNYYLAIAFEVISFLLIICFAPVKNLNKSITEKERKIFKLIVCAVSILLIAISVPLIFSKSVFVFSISLAMLLNSILIVIAIINSKLS